MGIIEIFEKFGLPIAFLMVMIFLFLKCEERSEKAGNDHKDERADWRDSQQKLQSDTNHALRELTKAITKLEKKK